VSSIVGESLISGMTSVLSLVLHDLKHMLCL